MCWLSKLCLQWNDFKVNATSAFEDLRNLGEYSDVTLVSGDGEAIEAHKVVLAASSPVLQNIFIIEGSKNIKLNTSQQEKVVL